MNKSSFGLPEKVIFCKKCVESNQRFLSSVQHKATADEKRQWQRMIAKSVGVHI